MTAHDPTRRRAPGAGGAMLRGSQITDSGYRRRTDILKAPGANTVLLGRAPRWALGAFGAPRVQRLPEIVQRELTEAQPRQAVLRWRRSIRES